MEDIQNQPQTSDFAVGASHYERFPSEIWHYLVTKFLRGTTNRPTLSSLTLTNHYFRSLAQPHLFKTFRLSLMASLPARLGNPTGFCQTEDYKSSFLQRFAFVTSPRIARGVMAVRVDDSTSTTKDEDIIIGAESLVQTLFDHLACFPRLSMVRVTYCPLTFHSFEQLFSLNRLERLFISYCPLNLSHFPRIPHTFRLKKLGLSDLHYCQPGLGNEWWLQLAETTLEYLVIHDKKLSEAFWSHLMLQPSPRLFSLCRLFVKITDHEQSLAYLEALRSGFPNLTSLTAALYTIDDIEVVKFLLSQFPSLKEACTIATYVDAEIIAEVPAILTTVDISPALQSFRMLSDLFFPLTPGEDDPPLALPQSTDQHLRQHHPALTLIELDCDSKQLSWKR